MFSLGTSPTNIRPRIWKPISCPWSNVWPPEIGSRPEPRHADYFPYAIRESPPPSKVFIVINTRTILDFLSFNPILLVVAFHVPSAFRLICS